MRLRQRQPVLSHRHGAALYATVMAVALLVSVMGLAGLMVTGIERRQAESGNDLITARANAESAVELALRVIANDANWRTDIHQRC